MNYLHSCYDTQGAEISVTAEGTAHEHLLAQLERFVRSTFIIAAPTRSLSHQCFIVAIFYLQSCKTLTQSAKVKSIVALLNFRYAVLLLCTVSIL